MHAHRRFRRTNHQTEEFVSQGSSLWSLSRISSSWTRKSCYSECIGCGLVMAASLICLRNLSRHRMTTAPRASSPSKSPLGYSSLRKVIAAGLPVSAGFKVSVTCHKGSPEQSISFRIRTRTNDTEIAGHEEFPCRQHRRDSFRVGVARALSSFHSAPGSLKYIVGLVD